MAAVTLDCYPSRGSREPSEPQYVGLTLSKAKAKARASGMTVRILARDGRCLRDTLDLGFFRVNVWVSQGKVIRAQRF
jgi:hypothetical protein